MSQPRPAPPRPPVPGRDGLRIGRALKLVWQTAPGWTVAALVLILLQGVLPLLALYLLKLVIDNAALALASSDRAAAFEEVVVLVVYFGLVALAQAACRAGSRMVNEAQALTLTDHVFSLLHEKSIALDLEYYENPIYHDTLHRAQREAPQRPTRIVMALATAGQGLVSMIAVAGLLALLHWSVPLILVATALPAALARTKYAGRLYLLRRLRTPAERRSWYFHELLTRDVFAKELRLFDLGRGLIERFRELRKRLRLEQLALGRKRAFAELGGESVGVLAVFGLMVYIFHRTVHGSVTLGAMVMFYQAIQKARTDLQMILTGTSNLYENNLFLTNLYELLDLAPRLQEPDEPTTFPRRLEQGISIRDLSFTYPLGRRQALHDVNLEIRPGEMVALVGENGSGKTTLVKLLCRLYDADAGSIAFDGVPIGAVGRSDLLRQISVIFQDFVKYNLPAWENIALGNPEARGDRERIEEAAQRAGSHEVLSKLPEGYDTILGRQFEHGEELSIGEWQKVALARALLRDSQLIILDEPTAAVDAKAEAEFFDRFRDLVQDRSALVISHRFSTVRAADRIYVMDDGRVVESGTHDELMERGERYARLFELQARYYR